VLLTQIYLLDQKKLAEALSLGDMATQSLANDHRPSLRFFSGKFWFYTSRSYELSGKLSEVRPRLLAAFRTACLHHDESGQACLLNLLLRNYLQYNLYDQAVKLISKTSFPDARVNSQYARYLFYLARVKAVQLEYSESHQYVLQALRKGPKAESKFGKGFRSIATKLSVVVELLMGEIPEKSTFMQGDLKDELQPYYKITRAVRMGDLATFRKVLSEHEATFQADQTISLIKRLRHNVIKTGLRSINVSYSCISLDDVAQKLGLERQEAVEGVVAKAIADGVIDATLHHEGKYLQSKPLADVYSTGVPQQALHKRIDFCLQLHNEAVKAMRYPGDGQKAAEEDEEERRERDKALMEAADNAEFFDDDDLFM